MVQRQILNSLKCQPIRDTECPDVQDDALIAGAKLKGNIQSRNVRTAQYTVAKLVINLEFQWHLLSVAGFCLSSIHQFFPAYLILNFLLLLVLFFCLHRYVRPVYVICQNSDGAFDAPEGEENSVESALARIATNARLLQTFTAENLYRHGLGRKTFRLEETEDGGVKVNIFKSKLDLNEALKMSGDELYGVFEKELMESDLFDPLCKFWVFMSCTRYCPPKDADFDETKISSYAKAHTALGGGCMALFGTGCLHTWAQNLDELQDRFTDERKIDKKKLFDDSYGRGFHWANYSTTLGAAMHELGHCFNLAHTPDGIMGRGFDDMNKFFTVHNTEAKPEGECHHDPYRDGGAHWYRSSAVVLSLSKWIGNRPNAVDQECLPMVYCDPNTRGPVGNNGPYHQQNQITFDSEAWLKSNNLTFGGLIVSAEKYVNNIQIIGYQLSCTDTGYDTVTSAWLSPTYGSQKQKTDKRIIFALESPSEHINRLEVHAGAWIDGLRIHSNMKSSVWIGGSGGDLNELRAPDGQWFDNIFGTTGRYVGSIGVKLNSEKVNCTSGKEDCYHFEALDGIRHIEVRDDRGEIIKHWEYLDSKDSPCIKISREELMLNGRTTCIMMVDGEGKSHVTDLSFERTRVKDGSLKTDMN